MFVQLNGNLPVVAIRKKHALNYRKALQDVPKLRKGALLLAPLPAQAEWGREHPDEPKITAATINKQLGAVQSVCVWANDNGLVPDDAQWTDCITSKGVRDELRVGTFGREGSATSRRHYSVQHGCKLNVARLCRVGI
jgi:hypothetical protein